MSKYPSLDDPKFYEKINKIFQKYTIPKPTKSINDYCKPKKFTLQPPQDFLSHYINPNTPYKSILIYHRIGAGKTCSAIQIAEQWKHKKKIVFVLPASLKGSFKNELRGYCGGNEYMTDTERATLTNYLPSEPEYIAIIKKSDKRIEEYYNIYSYNKFIELAQNNRINLNNSILIIDEIQNMVSETGLYYKELYDLIHRSSKNLRIVLLSATPIFDRPVEIALTMNLLNPSPNIPIGRNFNEMFIKETRHGNNTHYTVKNMDIFKKLIKGYVSYYMGAPAFTFPEMTIKYVDCEMSNFQYSIYKQILSEELGINNHLNRSTKEDIIDMSDLPNNFYIGTRFASNVVYPNKKLSDYGLSSLNSEKIKDHLMKYSCKLSRMMKIIKRSHGKSFIYSAFKEYAGLKTVIKVLETFGYKNYKDHGIGPKRFAIWSGDESTSLKDEIREIYNRSDNLYGDKLKIILGSPSIKEGVSLKAVRYVHVLEPYWNQSRLEQIIGRASRYCSHISLPEDKRNVRVYVYIATHPNVDETIDQYIKNISETKRKIIKQFEKAIMEAAVDCQLNKNANKIEGEVIHCVTS